MKHSNQNAEKLSKKVQFCENAKVDEWVLTPSWKLSCDKYSTNMREFSMFFFLHNCIFVHIFKSASEEISCSNTPSIYSCRSLFFCKDPEVWRIQTSNNVSKIKHSCFMTPVSQNASTKTFKTTRLLLYSAVVLWFILNTLVCPRWPKGLLVIRRQSVAGRRWKNKNHLQLSCDFIV